MKLTKVRIQRFRNFVDAQTMDVEPDVTCLVGKNESGKTAVLRALHRLKPANGLESENAFDLTVDYPRWRLARDRKADADLATTTVPISATFLLEAADRAALAAEVPLKLPEGTVCEAARRYDNTATVGLRLALPEILKLAATDAAVVDEDLEILFASTTLDSARAAARSRAAEVKATEGLRAKALEAFVAESAKYNHLCQSGAPLTEAQRSALWELVPSSFYFSAYNLLPGECDLTELAARKAAAAAANTKGTFSPAEQTVLALLRHAGETPSDFLDDNYTSRKAELQAAASDLTRHVFEYWRQNTDLGVVFDDDNVNMAAPGAVADLHRLLKIEIRDGRHGDVETNFATRSAGFQWFFSFFAAFSEYQSSTEPLVVLLDEPGTSLHGDAQQDFVRYVFNELGASKTTIYTTHSQHMVDPSRYEKLRAIHDRATRESPDPGVEITRVDLSADRATILPVEAALGQSVSQHLFIGSGPHLTVEGSSDFVFIMRVSEYAIATGKVSLDPHFSIIPVGGAANMPAFVALMGRRLKVTALIDGAKTTQTAARVRAAAKENSLPDGAVVVCGEIADGLPATADIEDLFDVADYLRLYNWAFAKSVRLEDLPATAEPILRRLEILVGEFDHALPAHALTDHRAEFFVSVSDTTVARFTALFEKLNETLATVGS